MTCDGCALKDELIEYRDRKLTQAMRNIERTEAELAREREARVKAERDRDELRRGVDYWLQHHLSTNLKHRGYADPSGHPHGGGVVEIPEWDIKRKLDDITPPAPETSAPGGVGEESDQ